MIILPSSTPTWWQADRLHDFMKTLLKYRRQGVGLQQDFVLLTSYILERLKCMMKIESK